MSQQELVRKVVRALEESGIDYMMTGSVVSSMQGEPRSTHDIDLVVAMKPSDIKRLVRYFPASDYYLDEKSILDALETKNTFSLLDIHEGTKVDFWILTDDLFDRSRFSRKYTENYMGMKLKVSCPEDTILMKLKWAKLSGGSKKQFTDALRVFEIQRNHLDIKYIEEWIKKLNLDILWNKLKNSVDHRPDNL